MVALAVQSLPAGGIRGRVVTTTGEPIVGAIVFSPPIAEAKTDGDGKFLLGAVGDFVWFSARGYLQVTRTVEEIKSNAEVQLLADPRPIWMPPVCSPAKAAG